MIPPTRGRLLTASAVGIAIASSVSGCSVDARPSPSIPSEPRASTSPDGGYADGTYQATGWYGSLPSSIEVSVTLAGDIVTGVSVTPNATNPVSLDFQTRFASAIPAVVVGKAIDEIRVDKIAGSSGTPDGFNDALQAIKRDAAIPRD